MSKNFGDYPSNSIWLMPIIAEIGRKYESRHRFVDTLSFYEWALNQGLNGRNRDQIRLRWIYNKEQKGDMEEARQRRLQWGFPEQGELPLQIISLHGMKLSKRPYSCQKQTINQEKRK